MFTLKAFVWRKKIQHFENPLLKVNNVSDVNKYYANILGMLSI